MKNYLSNNFLFHTKQRFLVSVHPITVEPYYSSFAISDLIAINNITTYTTYKSMNNVL